jgi:NAD(P)H-flavin reductase
MKLADSDSGIPVLVENSYGPHMSVVESPAPRPSLEYPNIVCIAGGVGISGVLPTIVNNGGTWGTKKLFWGVRTEPLVQAVRDIVGDPRYDAQRDGSCVQTWAGADVAVFVGKRFDIDAVLTKEAQMAVGGVTVVVCGPDGMADEVRVTVARLGKAGVVIRLIEVSFAG